VNWPDARARSRTSGLVVLNHHSRTTMNKIVFIALGFCLAALGGCAVYTPAGSVVVDPAGAVAPPPAGNAPGPSSSGGGFCPPGQAKKGNC